MPRPANGRQRFRRAGTLTRNHDRFAIGIRHEFVVAKVVRFERPHVALGRVGMFDHARYVPNFPSTPRCGRVPAFGAAEEAASGLRESKDE